MVARCFSLWRWQTFVNLKYHHHHHDHVGKRNFRLLGISIHLSCMEFHTRVYQESNTNCLENGCVSIFFVPSLLSHTSSQTAKSRSQARRVKVGRLEPGDLWGMQHMQQEAESKFDVLAAEACEVSVYSRHTVHRGL